LVGCLVSERFSNVVTSRVTTSRTWSLLDARLRALAISLPVHGLNGLHRQLVSAASMIDRARNHDAQPVERLWNLRHERLRRGWGRLHAALQLGDRTRRCIRARPPDEHVVEDEAERIDIRALIDAPTLRQCSARDEKASHGRKRDNS
jgi:hypothetical protein